jgi:hypothetical protein
MYDIQTFDSVFTEDQRDQYWNYIENQIWHVYWKPLSYVNESYNYVPAKEKRWRTIDPARLIPNMIMPRAGFASDLHSLQNNHPVLFDLWTRINNVLGNEFEIAGDPEGFASDGNGDPQWVVPPTQDPTMEQGWRVYANAQPTETVKRSHGVHRDCIDLEKDGYYTCLYFANPIWYPSWFAENIFYPNDESTDDNQQYQGIYKDNQNRGYGIGWGDEGKTVSPKPGRILIYDSRTLHTTKPTASWAKTMRKAIAFRIRKKTQ